MDEVSLVLSIEEYKKQLEEVGQSLHYATREQKPQLEELQLNLIQLLELTLGQLENVTTVSSVEKDGDSSNAKKSQEEDKLSKEMALFKAEMSELCGDEEEVEKKARRSYLDAKFSQKNSGRPSVDSFSNLLTSDSESEEPNETCEVLKLLKQLEDKEVRAPFVERWGGHSYHNAVVLHPYVDEDGNPDADDPKVVVLYSHPTSKAMLPCKYFMDGRCQFSDEDCHFSHGAAVSVGDLREYSIPDHDSIVCGSRILTCHTDDDLWHPGVVEDVLSGRKGFSFKCDKCNIVVETCLEKMIPLSADDDASIQSQKRQNVRQSLSDDGNSSDATQEDPNVEFIPTHKWLNTAVHQKLGDWEKYTKGIASKLMASMGYIEGTGLGPKGEGRIDPVPAYVYPQGVSLDHCMKLRLSSGGEEMLQVEKRLLKQQKKQEEKEKQKSKARDEKTDLFSIINEKLAIRKDPAAVAKSSDDKNARLNSQSSKELNRQNLQLNSSINRLENELKKLEESKMRQKNDTNTVKAIDERIRQKREELRSMISAERSLHREQKKRKDVKNMCVF